MNFLKKLVKMAAQDEVDVCESWEDMDEIGVSFIVNVVPCVITIICQDMRSNTTKRFYVLVRSEDQADVPRVRA